VDTLLDIVLVATGVVSALALAAFHRLQRWSFSPPFLGLVAGVALGAQGLGVLPAAAAGDALHIGSRLLLAVGLMAVALRYPARQIRQHRWDVALLIVVTLPVMAGVMAASAGWALGLPLGAALVLGAALSPTDPVLASGVVTGRDAERDIASRDRQLLSLESGANDGLALPIVGLALAVALDQSVGAAVIAGLSQVIGGVLVGGLIGAASGRVMTWGESRREISSSARALYPLLLASLVLGASELLGINGLLGVFVAGLLHGRTVAAADRRIEEGLDETLNLILVVPLFVLFGAALPWSAWAATGLSGAAVVATALLLRRMPIVLALRRPLRLDMRSALWLGWFGPIGVAALFYLGDARSEGMADPRVWTVGTLVVAVSTVIHGLTAAPARRAYARRPAPPGADR